MTDLLRDLDCDVWVDDVFDFEKDDTSSCAIRTKFLAGQRVLVCSSLLTSALFSLANWFGVEKCILILSCRMIPPVSKV